MLFGRRSALINSESGLWTSHSHALLSVPGGHYSRFWHQLTQGLWAGDIKFLNFYGWCLFGFAFLWICLSSHFVHFWVQDISFLFVSKEPKELAFGLLCLTEISLSLDLALKWLAICLLKLGGVQVEARRECWLLDAAWLKRFELFVAQVQGRATRASFSSQGLG